MMTMFAARALASELTLVQTCAACPEQYDVFHNEELVGYMRLRHGIFRAECPGPDSELVYMSGVIGSDAGCFSNEEERKMNLDWAKIAISEWILTRKANK